MVPSTHTHTHRERERDAHTQTQRERERERERERDRHRQTGTHTHTGMAAVCEALANICNSEVLPTPPYVRKLALWKNRLTDKAVDGLARFLCSQKAGATKKKKSTP